MILSKLATVQHVGIATAVLAIGYAVVFVLPNMGMIALLDTLNFVSAFSAVILSLGGAVFLFDLYTNRLFETFVARYGLMVAFMLAAAGSVVTLVYSEIFGFLPCVLCWYQRIFLYPQAIMLGVALYTKDRMIPLYGIALSIPGLLIALYHHYHQMGGELMSGLITCSAAGGDCAERTFIEFGFVTFPLMAAALFFFLLALYLYLYRIR